MLYTSDFTKAFPAKSENIVARLQKAKQLNGPELQASELKAPEQNAMKL